MSLDTSINALISKKFMNPGNLVRFKRSWCPIEGRPWLIGLLIEYDNQKKTATILYDDELYMGVGISDIQRYGRRYLER